MTQPNPVSVEIDLLYDLAKQVKERFMPAVFTCACEGTDPSCAKILRENGQVWERRDAVTAIAQWLLDQATDREDHIEETERDIRREDRRARWAQ